MYVCIRMCVYVYVCMSLQLSRTGLSNFGKTYGFQISEFTFQHGCLEKSGSWSARDLNLPRLNIPVQEDHSISIVILKGKILHRRGTPFENEHHQVPSCHFRWGPWADVFLPSRLYRQMLSAKETDCSLSHREKHSALDMRTVIPYLAKSNTWEHVRFWKRKEMHLKVK